MAINSRAIIRRAPRGNKTEQRYADRLELLRTIVAAAIVAAAIENEAQQ